MEFPILIILICCLLGSIAGFLSGLLGIGGGLIIVPALLWILPTVDFPPQFLMVSAVATSLATIAVTSTSAIRAHHKNQNVEWSITKVLLIGVAIGTIIGSSIAEHIPGDILKRFFAILVLVIAIKMLIARNWVSTRKASSGILSVAGTVTGVISSLIGIGGAPITVPTLIWLNLEAKKAVATASVCANMVAVVGSIGYILTGIDNTNLPEWTFGYIYLPALLGIISTSIFTAPIGANLANRWPTSKLRKTFTGFLIIVGLEMLFF